MQSLHHRPPLWDDHGDAFNTNTEKKELMMGTQQSHHKEMEVEEGVKKRRRRRNGKKERERKQINTLSLQTIHPKVEMKRLFVINGRDQIMPQIIQRWIF